jgi:hypothetical protein
MTRQPQKASSLNNQLLGKCGGVHSWEKRKKMEEQSTLSWALSYFAGTGSTIVIAHVPSQMIPVSRCRSFFLASHPIPIPSFAETEKNCSDFSGRQVPCQ